MYITASGVAIPQGTDAFTPPTQFKAWGDGAAAYENRVIVALDSDRTALAAPVLREGLECYVIGTQWTWMYFGGVWKLWSTPGILTYTTPIVNYVPATDVPLQRWGCAGGRVTVEGKLQIASGGGFTGSVAIMTPIAMSSKYSSANYALGTGSYLVPGNFIYQMGVVSMSATDRVQMLPVSTTGTYGTYGGAMSASIPQAQAVGYMISWQFEYEPA